MDHLITSTFFNEKDSFGLSKQMEILLTEKDPWKCFIIELNFKQILQSSEKIAKFFVKRPKAFIEKLRMSMIRNQHSLNNESNNNNNKTKTLIFGLKETNIGTNSPLETKPRTILQGTKKIKRNIQIVPQLPDSFEDKIESLLSPWNSRKGDSQELCIQRDFREELTILRGRIVRVSQPKMWEKLSLFECSECKQLQVVQNELNALENDSSTIFCLADPDNSSQNIKIWNRNNIQTGTCQSKLRQRGEGILGKFVEVHLEIESRKF
jgi:DNA replicative helicase MCM subunit Mcm2 (Cdc46/Mcm family)